VGELSRYSDSLRAGWVPGLFPGSKAAGAWRSPSTPSSADVKARIELYLYSPLWPVLE
jgi:hypothetical protein